MRRAGYHGVRPPMLALSLPLRYRRVRLPAAILRNKAVRGGATGNLHGLRAIASAECVGKSMACGAAPAEVASS